MNINDVYPSRWLKASDLSGDTTVTIKSVKAESVGKGNDAKDNRAVAYFNELEKGCVLNVTNKNTIVNLYGLLTEQWIGKRITLFATEVDYQGSQILAIRVRMRAPESAQSAPTGGVQGGITVEQLRDEAKRAAWAQFKAAYPNLAQDALVYQFKQSATAYFNGTPPDATGWRRFADDRFTKQPVTAPAFDEIGPGADIDCPF
jgi:hypothetical protein